MKSIISKYENANLNHLVQHLILNTSYITNLGLYHGKMGVVLFFYHYSDHIGDSLYNDFAGELLDEIYDELHVNIPLDFENGLCGIGWSIEYLIQRGYIQGNSDEILSDIDTRIMEWDPKRIINSSFRTGLGGIVYYVLTRLTASNKKKRIKPFDEAYCLDLWRTVRKKMEKEEEDMGCNYLLQQYFNYNYNERLALNTSPFFNIINSNTISFEQKNAALGLEGGCAGIGLKMISK
ncbi:MAG: hypothetical protein LBP83_06835 [Dysgonamonadaceae bacterium]|jgi:lantibiotic modifying enzyme|nr:hypothetical protein [Dysgonamonadaceae bacterium]